VTRTDLAHSLAEAELELREAQRSLRLANTDANRRRYANALGDLRALELAFESATRRDRICDTGAGRP